MKVLFCGGGTAGHITPSIALAEEILSEKSSEVIFVGREGGAENKLITDLGYPLYTVSVSGFKRKLSLSNFKTLTKLVGAISESKKLIKELRPDVVVGTGGYVCLPVLMAARKLGIPTLLHESNATPGLTTRLLAKKCTRLILGSEDEYGLYKLKNARIYGNPTRRAFGAQTKYQARKKLGLSMDKFFILSVGGSLGAETLNEYAITLMREYSSRTKNVVHIHATGMKHYEATLKAEPILCEGTPGCKILPYINDMPTYLCACDVIITRCGAMTLSEIAACSAIPILIPSPNVTANHQYKNAKRFEEAGAGILIEEKDLSNAALVSAVKRISSSPKLRDEIKRALRSLERPDTKSDIIKEIKEISK